MQDVSKMPWTSFEIALLALLSYSTTVTILLVNLSRVCARKEKLIERLNEKVILHRRLVNELQKIGEDEVGAILELERIQQGQQ